MAAATSASPPSQALANFSAGNFGISIFPVAFKENSEEKKNIPVNRLSLPDESPLSLSHSLTLNPLSLPDSPILSHLLLPSPLHLSAPPPPPPQPPVTEHSGALPRPVPSISPPTPICRNEIIHRHHCWPPPLPRLPLTLKVPLFLSLPLSFPLSLLPSLYGTVSEISFQVVEHYKMNIGYLIKCPSEICNFISLLFLLFSFVE